MKKIILVTFLSLFAVSVFAQQRRTKKHNTKKQEIQATPQVKSDTLPQQRTVTVTSASNALTVGGIIGGSFGLTKAGAGILVLSGANTYTGVTTITTGITITSRRRPTRQGLKRCWREMPPIWPRRRPHVGFGRSQKSCRLVLPFNSGLLATGRDQVRTIAEPTTPR